jgi:hypothetical protein
MNEHDSRNQLLACGFSFSIAFQEATVLDDCICGWRLLLSFPASRSRFRKHIFKSQTKHSDPGTTHLGKNLQQTELTVLCQRDDRNNRSEWTQRTESMRFSLTVRTIEGTYILSDRRRTVWSRNFEIRHEISEFIPTEPKFSCSSSVVVICVLKSRSWLSESICRRNLVGHVLYSWKTQGTAAEKTTVTRLCGLQRLQITPIKIRALRRDWPANRFFAEIGDILVLFVADRVIEWCPIAYQSATLAHDEFRRDSGIMSDNSVSESQNCDINLTNSCSIRMVIGVFCMFSLDSSVFQLSIASFAIGWSPFLAFDFIWTFGGLFYPCELGNIFWVPLTINRFSSAGNSAMDSSSCSFGFGIPGLRKNWLRPSKPMYCWLEF